MSPEPSLRMSGEVPGEHLGQGRLPGEGPGSGIETEQAGCLVLNPGFPHPLWLYDLGQGP